MTKYLTLQQVYKKIGMTPEDDTADIIKDVYDLLMWTCTRCGYNWPKKGGAVPGTCANPKCKSPYWNKKKTRT